VKKSFITAIISLLSISLAGIIVLQGLWINNSWQTKQEDFYRSVNEALNNVVLRMEKQEAMSFLNSRYLVSSSQGFWYQQRGSISIASPGSKDSILLFDDFLSASQASPFSGLNLQGELTNDSMRIVRGTAAADTGKHKSLEKRVKMKANQFNDLFYQMVMEWSSVQVPIERRIHPEELYKLIRQELNKKGIDLPFQFAVVMGAPDSLCEVKSPSFDLAMVPASFRTHLYPNDIFSSPYHLLLHFNDMRPYLIKSLWWMLLLSAVFLILIIATFSSAIYVIIKQKKVSEIKTDFINNMTHELKTPIATISVALDAINNPKVLSDKDRIRYYSGIIGNENKRMNLHVENILQMALVDKENFELNEQLLNVHDIIQHVADQVQPPIENRNGKLDLELDAENFFVVGDEIHLTNVFYNLIENAIKYSPESPEITVTTKKPKRWDRDHR